MNEILHYLLMCLCLVAASSVASNPSPFFGALGLVAVSLTSCVLLLLTGGNFLSLILVLIYLGGMLVVFAYSSALAADRYPIVLTNPEVLSDFILYLTLLGMLSLVLKKEVFKGHMSLLMSSTSSVRGDIGGISLSFSLGKNLMVTAGIVLLITLFAALELVRGMVRGGLRAI